MFQTVPLSIIRSLALYTEKWYMSYRFCCQETCMTYTIAECTVLNPWWWMEELYETCIILFQNKFEKLVRLVGFIIRVYHNAWSSECQINLYMFYTQNMSVFLDEMPHNLIGTRIRLISHSQIKYSRFFRLWSNQTESWLGCYYAIYCYNLQTHYHWTPTNEDFHFPSGCEIWPGSEHSRCIQHPL